MTSMTTPPFEIGKRLGSVRALRGLSQGTVSRLAGIAPSYLSKIENGRIQPTFPTLWRIMRALHASFEDVVGLEPVLDRRRAICPISASGECLTQLIRSEREVALDRRRVFVSTRDVRLLRDLLAWLRCASADHAHALEVLLEDVIQVGSPPS